MYQTHLMLVSDHSASNQSMRWQGCTAPLSFEMDCNAPLSFQNFINNVRQMGVQNQIPNKAMHPCFQIPNAPVDLVAFQETTDKPILITM